MADELTTTNSGQIDTLTDEAELLAASSLVPECFRGKPNDIRILLQLARRHNIDAFCFLQNCYVVHGKPGIETKLAIALLNISGKTVGPIRYTFEGEKLTDLICIATVRDATIGIDISHALSWKSVETNGWDKNPSWKHDPKMMLEYRAAIRLIRSSYPEVLLGTYTTDELDDWRTVDATPQRPVSGLSERYGLLSSSHETAAKETTTPLASEPDQPEPNTKSGWRDNLDKCLATARSPEDVEAARRQFADIADADEVNGICDAFLADISEMDAKLF